MKNQIVNKSMSINEMGEELPNVLNNLNLFRNLSGRAEFFPLYFPINDIGETIISINRSFDDWTKENSSPVLFITIEFNSLIRIEVDLPQLRKVRPLLGDMYDGATWIYENEKATTEFRNTEKFNFCLIALDQYF